MNPLRDYVLVAPIEENVTESGIILHEVTKNRKEVKKGKVMAKGPDTWQVEVGNIVQYKPLNVKVDSIDFEGSSCFLTKEDELLTILK